MMMATKMPVLGGWTPPMAEGATSMHHEENLLGLVPVGATTTQGMVPEAQNDGTRHKIEVLLGLVPAGATATQNSMVLVDMFAVGPGLEKAMLNVVVSVTSVNVGAYVKNVRRTSRKPK